MAITMTLGSFAQTDSTKIEVRKNHNIIQLALNAITKKLSDAEMADVEKLIEKLEEDDDVMNVYHTMQE